MKKIGLYIVFLFCFSSSFSQSENNSWQEKIKTGWCVYSMACYDTAHLSSLKKHRPEIIRWFMEWDRFDFNKKGKSVRQFHLDRCRPFFKICAENNIIIVVQMWVKERFWGGDGKGGTQWAKAGKMLNYPGNTEKSYGSFVRDLIKTMKEEGVTTENIIMEAWNEPDLLWGVKGDPANYHEPWKVFDKKGFNKWSGGSGEKWKALHHVLDSTDQKILWANGSVGIHSRYSSWIDPAYKIDKISVLDIHYYLWMSTSAEQYCDSLSKIVDMWDKKLPEGKTPYKFFIGEINRYSSGTTEQQKLVTADAAMIREICKILTEKYGDRFMGVTVHAPINMWKDKPWYSEEYKKD